MPRLSMRQSGRLLEAAKRDAKPSERTRFRAPNGDMILCESRAERDWWEQFTSSLVGGQMKPEEFSVRDIFESIIPDGRSICDAWQRGENVSLQEAAGATSSALFANIGGQVVYTKMLESFVAEDLVFSKRIPTVPTPFNGEKIPGIAGIGDNAEVVPEGDPYPVAGVSEDYVETPSTVKRGLIVPFTKEAIFFDRTNMILKRAGEVGDYLAVNKEKRAIDCVIDENTTAHRYKWRSTSYATYQTSTPWINSKTSNALVDWTDVDALEQLFANLVDPNTGEPIILKGLQLIVTPQLYNTAKYILQATQIALQAGGFATNGNLFQTQAPNPVGSNSPFSGPYELVTSRRLPGRLATDTDWFLGDIAGAFAYMENFPLTVVTSPPNSEDEFKRDIVVQYKASERGAYTVVQPRKICKSAQ
jgi:hypothetical protein